MAAAQNWLHRAGTRSTRLTKRCGSEGVITRFGPFFDAAELGGAFCLCAMSVPAERFEEVARIVNAHPEVAHNYERVHKFNMWFVLATETADEIGSSRGSDRAGNGAAVAAVPQTRGVLHRL